MKLSLLDLTQILLVVLKLLNIISISWWLVFTPLYVALALNILAVIALIGTAILVLKSKID